MKAKAISRNFDPVFAEKFLRFKFAPYSEAPDDVSPGALLIWFVGGPCDGGVEYFQGDLEPPEFIDLEDDNTGRYHLRQNKYHWIARIET